MGGADRRSRRGGGLDRRMSEGGRRGRGSKTGGKQRERERLREVHDTQRTFNQPAIDFMVLGSLWFCYGNQVIARMKENKAKQKTPLPYQPKMAGNEMIFYYCTNLA